MSRTHDVVEIVTDDVRVSVRELTIEQLCKLFQFYHSAISRHYRVQHGGSSFSPWKGQIFSDKPYGANTLRDAGIKHLKNALFPAQGEYDSKTRIHPLYMQMFYLPDLERPSSYRTRSGSGAVCCRLCLTQSGALYLEWYEGVQESCELTIHNATYYPVSSGNWELTGNQKLLLLLKQDPDLVGRFGHQVLYLLDRDAGERERKAERDRKLFNELNARGRLVDITYEPS